MATWMLSHARRSVVGCLVALLSLPLASCCGLSTSTTDMPQKAYVATDDGTIFARYAPIFVLETYAKTYNRIGSAAARLDEDREEEVYVDPAAPSFYVQKRQFQTERGSYTNLIYRVEFPGVPFPKLTAGANAGLLVIITLNTEDEPVLVTTDLTCGCYPALVPTDNLPPKALPQGWDTGGQCVLGEELPGLIRFPKPFDSSYRPVILLRDGTHRVMGMRVESVKEAAWRYGVVPARLQPMDALDAVPVDGGTTSYFVTSGPKRGLVKDAARPLEFLLISWWAMDSSVGRPKRYADSRESGKVFYTSLKFWRREDSDMWRFPEFLRFWGWRL